MKININGVTREMTTQEEAELTVTPTTEEQIAALKQQLADTDYKAIKYAEGEILEEEYQLTRQQRRLWREEINRLEQEVI